VSAGVPGRPEVRFEAELEEWRGPAPFVWLRIPEDACEEVRGDAEEASYGWGAVPVRVRIGATEWETSMLPKDGSYVVPVKQAVRRAEGIDLGDVVVARVTIAPRGGRAAGGTGRAR
jgi:hypothetical protein